MLEAAVHDGAQDLRLEEKVPEAGAVNGDVVALDSLLLGLDSVLLGGGISGGHHLRLLLLLVVQQVLVHVALRHFFRAGLLRLESVT